jgi:23S rRNA (adenine2503-C2)-methyltransferase
MDIIKDIKSLELDELKDAIKELHEKPFKANQIYDWLHQKKVTSFDDMTNLSKETRLKLKENYQFLELACVETLTSAEDGTKKFLFMLHDHQVIETVLMNYKHGLSVCISSQAGCRMGCNFCASTIGGLIRNLEPSEMLEQIYYIERQLDCPISNIVVMGTGEPFDNYDNLLKFLRIITSKEGRNLSQRSITVSTCGIVPRIDQFANEGLQVNLAISLHGPDDEIRQSMMPIAKKYQYDILLASCKNYTDKTNRRITFEYSLINGVNDSVEQATKLAASLKGMLCHVNLIQVNQVEGKDYTKTSESKAERFKNILIKHHISTTIRRSLGRDIEAACGQLRRKYIEKQTNTE